MEHEYFYTPHKNFPRCELHEYSSLQRIHAVADGIFYLSIFICIHSSTKPKGCAMWHGEREDSAVVSSREKQFKMNKTE